MLVESAGFCGASPQWLQGGSLETCEAPSGAVGRLMVLEKEQGTENQELWVPPSVLPLSAMSCFFSGRP